MLTFLVRKPNGQRAVIEIKASIEGNTQLVLEAVGARMMTFLKSLTEGERGWVSRTPVGGLADSYDYKVTRIKGGWRLTIRNTAFYSIILELRDGLFVLTGVTDPGGPFEQKLVEVCAEMAPGFRVVRAA